MNAQEKIETYCQKLRLPYIRDHHKTEIDNAVKAKLTFHDFLHDILKGQILQRIDNTINRSIKSAGFNSIKRLEEFDFSFQPQIDEKRITELGSLQFIEDKQNIVFLGPPGVGKTHLATSLGVKACQQQLKVSFFTVQNLINELKIAQATNQLVKLMRKLTKVDLLIIDELGYMKLDSISATLFFQLISHRYEKGSIIITSNKQPDQWGKVFNDDVIATAILDRVFHHCHHFIITGKSYRMKNIEIHDSQNQNK